MVGTSNQSVPEIYYRYIQGILHGIVKVSMRGIS